jgi:two-component system chemotaxis response regulator CheB
VKDRSPDAASGLVLLAASAGGVPALLRIVSGLPAGFPAAVVVVCHRTSRIPSLLPALLARGTMMRVRPVSR